MEKTKIPVIAWIFVGIIIGFFGAKFFLVKPEVAFKKVIANAEIPIDWNWIIPGNFAAKHESVYINKSDDVSWFSLYNPALFVASGDNLCLSGECDSNNGITVTAFYGTDLWKYAEQEKKNYESGRYDVEAGTVEEKNIDGKQMVVFTAGDGKFPGEKEYFIRWTSNAVGANKDRGLLVTCNASISKESNITDPKICNHFLETFDFDSFDSENSWGYLISADIWPESEK